MNLANIDNCNTERLVTELYACYTTENDPCGPDCASGYLTIRKWFCFCNCEECCLQKQYYVCDVCSSGYIATSDSLRCVGGFLFFFSSFFLFLFDERVIYSRITIRY